MTWTVELLNETVESELLALPTDMLARFTRITDLISAHGLTHVREPYVKHLGDKLWEIRVKGKAGISRAIYVTAKPKRVVVVRVFVKKTQKTPTNELKIARRRVREFFDGEDN